MILMYIKTFNISNIIYCKKWINRKKCLDLKKSWFNYSVIDYSNKIKLNLILNLYEGLTVEPFISDVKQVNFPTEISSQLPWQL